MSDTLRFNMFRAKSGGFTLIELIIVIAIIAIVTAGSFVALDPVRRLNMTRNARRVSDVQAIAKAMSLKVADTQTLTGVDAEVDVWQMLGTGTDCGVTTCEGSDGILSTGSMQLDGVNEFLFSSMTTPFDIDPLTSSVTISAWIILDEIGENPVISKINSSGNGIALSVDGTGKAIFTIGNGTPAGSKTVESLTSLGFSTPYHIAAKYDHTTEVVTIFVNGNDVSNITQNGTVAPLASGEPLRIGAMPQSSPQTGLQYYKGAIDDLRMYSRALTVDEIRALAIGKDVTAQLGTKWDFENANDIAYESVYGGNIEVSGTPVQSSTVPSILNGKGALFVASQCLDMTAELVNSGYLPRIPYDPLVTTSDTRTFYLVNRDGAHTAVRACSAESEGIGGTGEKSTIEVAF